MKVSTGIARLESILRKSNDYIVSGGWQFRQLHSNHLNGHCQVFECINSDKVGAPMGLHFHQNSKETFYQVVGETKFDDGTVIQSGEIKVILPGVPHSPILSSDGICIVIVQPIEEAYMGGPDGVRTA